jgi:hypothetical protein
VGHESKIINFSGPIVNPLLDRIVLAKISFCNLSEIVSDEYKLLFPWIYSNFPNFILFL